MINSIIAPNGIMRVLAIPFPHLSRRADGAAFVF
jgi:hypothetical protein